MNKISRKYTVYIGLCILTLTIMFIPFFLIFQKSFFINFEKNRMVSFADSFMTYYLQSSKDEADLVHHINDSNSQEYDIRLYDENELIQFSSVRHPLKKTQFYDTAEIRFNKKLYITNARPDTEDNLRKIVLRKLYTVDGNNYYFYCRQGLKNIDSLISYTDRMLLILLLIYAVACCGILYVLLQKLTEPIRQLSQVTETIANGDYTVRYNGPVHNDEIGILTENVNDMINTIQGNISSLQNWNYFLHNQIADLNEYAEERRRISAMITHELKTPLAVISSQLEMMNIIQDEEKKEFYYESCISEIDRMSEMISGILDDAAKENALFSGDKEDVDISQLVRNLCSSSRSFVESRGLRFREHIQEGCVKCLYKEHIKYVFNNYLTNAVRHAKSGGSIEVKLYIKEKAVYFSIFNEGEPIPEEDKDKIWIDYFSTWNKKEAASDNDNFGLGLFIVKEIATLDSTRCGFLNHENGVEFWFDFINV